MICTASFRRVLALAAILLCLPFSPAARGQAQPPPQKDRIRVEVNLVNIIAGVLDQRGRPAPDLPKDAFELYEEGVRQKIEVFEAETQQPLDLALMIDSSLSTYKEFGFEREAAAHFIRQVVRLGDRLAVFEFSDSVTQLTNFSADVPLLQAAVRRMEEGAGTALYDAILLGSQALGRRPAGRRRVIVLVTDAGETTSQAKFDQARRAAVLAEAMIYNVIIRPVKSESGRNTAGEHALITITEAAGGAMYFPDTMADLDPIFDRIDRELRTQYRLGYYPEPRPPARSYRRVEVRVKGDYIVHARQGYFSSGVPE